MGIDAEGGLEKRRKSFDFHQILCVMRRSDEKAHRRKSGNYAHPITTRHSIPARAAVLTWSLVASALSSFPHQANVPRSEEAKNIEHRTITVHV